MDAIEILSQRIFELDQPQENRLAWAPAEDYCQEHFRGSRARSSEGTVASAECTLADIAYFITVIDQAEAVMAGESGPPFNVIEPEEADMRIAGCRLVRRIRDAAPDITSAPVRLHEQYWIATGRPDHLPAANRQLDRSDFNEVSVSDELLSHAKPFGIGLFSCTDVAGSHGMWRIHLDLNQGSDLAPLPWYTWKLGIAGDVAVREIGSAADWVEFVDYYPRAGKQGFLYPDWLRIARDYDGVHVALPAVAAIEGLPFPARNGLVAPVFWGVESTLWLRWRITGQSLCEIVA